MMMINLKIIIISVKNHPTKAETLFFITLQLSFDVKLTYMLIKSHSLSNLKFH